MLSVNSLVLLGAPDERSVSGAGEARALVDRDLSRDLDVSPFDQDVRDGFVDLLASGYREQVILALGRRDAHEVAGRQAN